MANRATTNIFELLSDEPTPVAPKAEVVADKKPASTGPKDTVGSQKAVGKPANRPAAAGSKAVEQTNGSTSVNPAPYRKERSEGQQGDRHTREGRGRGRGGRGREFDHHVSGTGRPANENKKRGGGGHNWGKTDEAWDSVPEAGHATEEVKTDGQADSEAKPAEGDIVVVEPKEPVEPEPKQVSYEEYLATKAQAAKELAEKYNLKSDKRTVVDAGDLKNVTVIDKKNETAAAAAAVTSTQVRAKEGAKIKDGSHLLNFKQPVEERSSRGGRGGRGGDRGGRGGRGGGSTRGDRGDRGGRGGRGGARGASRPAATSAPKQGGATFDATQVNDAAFPSLAAGKA
jgi:plasminogen activator inhibitor 1 RNA-binding protein